MGSKKRVRVLSENLCENVAYNFEGKTDGKERNTNIEKDEFKKDILKENTYTFHRNRFESYDLAFKVCIII